MGIKDWFGKAKDAAQNVDMDEMMDKAKEVASDNVEKVKDAIDKAADFVDEKTGGRFSGQVDQGADAAKDAVEDFTEDE